MTEMIEMDQAIVTLNPHDAGGEAVTFKVSIFDNGDHDAAGIFTLGVMTLHSYGNSANITVGGVLPSTLRELADELEAKLAAAKASFN